MKRKMASGLILLTVLLAGCTAEPDARGGEGRGIGGPVGKGLGPFMFEFEDCQSTVMNSPVPAEWAAPFVPEGFTARFYGPALNFAVMHMLDCGRMLANGTVQSDVRFFELSLQGERDDEPGVGILINIDAYASDPHMRDVLTGMGATVQEAEILYGVGEIVSGADRRGWSVTSSSCSFSFEFPHTGISTSKYTTENTLWFDADPPLRLHRKQSYAVASPVETDVFLFNVNGQCPLKALFGNNERLVFDHQNRWDERVVYTLTGGDDA